MDLYEIILIAEDGTELSYTQGNRIIYMDDFKHMEATLRSVKGRYGKSNGRKFRGHKIVSYRVELYETLHKYTELKGSM